MVSIDWQEYKSFKKDLQTKNKLDNFEALLEFLRAYYNKSSAFEVFDMLNSDSLSKMMLEKRNITEPEDLEDILFRKLSI
jgi:hypothetical protein